MTFLQRNWVSWIHYQGFGETNKIFAFLTKWTKLLRSRQEITSKISKLPSLCLFIKSFLGSFMIFKFFKGWSCFLFLGSSKCLNCILGKVLQSWSGLKLHEVDPIGRKTSLALEHWLMHFNRGIFCAWNCFDSLEKMWKIELFEKYFYRSENVFGKMSLFNFPWISCSFTIYSVCFY